MSWKAIEYLDDNPGASIKDVVNHFAEDLQIQEQINYLRDEVDKVLELRVQLRPLYGQKMDIENNLMIIDADLDMEVMLKYPPRKGSEKERKAYKQELQQQHDEYQRLSTEGNKLKDEIELLEEEMAAIQQNAKNARRLIDLFNTYISILVRGGGLEAALTEQSKQQRNESTNSNMF